jgi:putative ABC transport system permease protein
VNNQLYLVVRSSLPSGSLLPLLRQSIAEQDPDQPIYAIRTLEEAFSDASFRERASGVVLLAFAGVGLALAAVGVYGVMAFSIASRRRELAIRTSLGADRGIILRAVLWQGSRMVAIGLTIGLIAATASGRLLRSLLFGVGAIDPMTFGLVILVVAAAAAPACIIPARRAIQIDPGLALRAE